MARLFPITRPWTSRQFPSMVFPIVFRRTYEEVKRYLARSETEE